MTVTFWIFFATTSTIVNVGLIVLIYVRDRNAAKRAAFMRDAMGRVLERARDLSAKDVRAAVWRDLIDQTLSKPTPKARERS